MLYCCLFGMRNPSTTNRVPGTILILVSLLAIVFLGGGSFGLGNDVHTIAMSISALQSLLQELGPTFCEPKESFLRENNEIKNIFMFFLTIFLKQ